MFTTVRYGRECNEKLMIAYSQCEVEEIMAFLAGKKAAGEIRGYEYFLAKDLDQAPHGVHTKTMSEALRNMDEPAWDRAHKIVNLDAAAAFFGEY